MNPNSLLVQWSGGFTTVTDSAAVTAAGGLVRRAFFSATDYTTKEAAEAAATQKLDELQGGQTVVAERYYGSYGTFGAPYFGWYVGDKIPVDNWDGSGTGMESLSVVAATVTEDEHRNASVIPEFKTKVQERSEQIATALRRAQPGLTSNTVSIARDDDRDTRQGKLELETLSWGFEGQLRDISPEFRFRRRCRATFWDLTLTTPGSTATALQLLKNGSAITGMSQNNTTTSTALFPAGVQHIALLIPNVVCTEFDTIRFDVTLAGTGAETLSCELLGAVSEIGV